MQWFLVFFPTPENEFMINTPHYEVPKTTLALLNQVYEVEHKLKRHGDPGNALRNLDKIKDIFEDGGLFYDDPMGQEFKETRTDIEATISGVGTENLVVVEVLKPIIRAGKRDLSRVVQKGIVVVESKK
jgi:hypothetical protein